MIAHGIRTRTEIAMEYVTRTGASFDRAAMIWLLRHFIEPDATITLLPADEVIAYAAKHDAIPFHHPKAELRHRGTATGFDALRLHFHIDDPPVGLMALVLRGVETRDKRLTQWSPGIAAIVAGMRLQAATDQEYLAAATLLLDWLYRWCQEQLAARE
jgi:hypothetical protein